MSKPVPSSSLGSLKSSSGSGSAPVSPRFIESKSSRSSSPVLIPTIGTRVVEQDNMNNNNRILQIEQNQQQTSSDINQIKLLLSQLLQSKTNNSNIETNTQSESNNNIYTNTTSSASIQPIVQSQNSNNSTIANIVTQRNNESSKINNNSNKIFSLSSNDAQSIHSYANNNNNMINASFANLNDSTILIDRDESKLLLNDSNVSSNILNVNNANTHANSNTNTNLNHNFNFISQLMPSPAIASQPTLTDLLTTGLKATAKQSDAKINNVHQLIDLLTEQAKQMISTSDTEHHQHSSFLLYSLQLFKLLFDFGLQATMQFHFALMKKVQQQETKLNDEQPMLMLNLVSTFGRLPNTRNLLYSIPIANSNGNNNNYSNKSSSSFGKSGYNARTSNQQYSKPFSGTPCEFHSKNGIIAKHSSAECRVAKQKQ
jgi:hypothetical protein